MEPKRLNKFISDSGFCSRREADKLLEQGRVTVNGRIPEPGQLVSEKDKVRIDDEMVRTKSEAPVYLLFNKPAGISTNTDLSVRNNIISALNYPASLLPIGFLDRDAEGLMFLSNESDWARRMTKADNKYEKEYIVTVDKLINQDFIAKIGQAGGYTPGENPKNFVVKEGPNRFRIVLEPGIHHHIKKLVEELGYKVVHLQRVRIADFTPAKIAVGHWRTLNPAEVESLKSVLNSRGRRSNTSGKFYNPDDFEDEFRPISAPKTRSSTAKPVAKKPARPVKNKLNYSANPKSAANRAGRKPSVTKSKPAAGKSSPPKSGTRKSRS